MRPSRKVLNALTHSRGTCRPDANPLKGLGVLAVIRQTRAHESFRSWVALKRSGHVRHPHRRSGGPILSPPNYDRFGWEADALNRLSFWFMQRLHGQLGGMIVADRFCNFRGHAHVFQSSLFGDAYSRGQRRRPTSTVFGRRWSGLVSCIDDKAHDSLCDLRSNPRRSGFDGHHSDTFSECDEPKILER